MMKRKPIRPKPNLPTTDPYKLGLYAYNSGRGISDAWGMFATDDEFDAGVDAWMEGYERGIADNLVKRISDDMNW